MHFLFTIFSLTAVVIIASRDAHLFVQHHDAKPFQENGQYHYQLDTQISSGFATVSDQLAITRLQAQIHLRFMSKRVVAVTMDNIKMGSLNRHVSEPGKVLPMEMFKKISIPREQDEILRLTFGFDYVDGIIENLGFDHRDNSWSKNIKRSVLNMLQSNIKQRNEPLLIDPYPEEENEFYQQEQTKQFTDVTMFTLPEITLEGECQTSYTINKMIPSHKYRTDSENKETDEGMFNVTKSIDFKSCKKIADIHFGPQIEKSCAKCNVEKLEEKKLDRTTVIRQVFVGNMEKFGIQRVELLSHYMFRMINAETERPMFTVVAGELNFVETEKAVKPLIVMDVRKEQLLYSIEWETNEKRFYMYGDEEFPNHSPFKEVTNKINQIEKLIVRLVNLWSDKIQGIESEATGVFTKIVELVRMCTGEELVQVNQKLNHENDRVEGSAHTKKAEEIFTDALSNAGTYNTIKYLVEKIISKEIEGVRAVRAITYLKGLPVPSDKQVDMLLRLCNSEVAHRSSSLKQTCWLTTGAIIGELCNDEITRRDGFERNLPKPGCQREKQQTFVKALLGLHKKGETRYEKILALKALGNAGLVESTHDLEMIISDAREDILVRIQAVDSLRRIRAITPRRIQRILLPIFQNTRERPEIRMAAISMILPTIPDNYMLDQIGYTLLKEPSHQVKSYVYSAMKHMSESPIIIEKKLSKHLKSLLHLAGITEETEEKFLRGSRFIRIPFYSAQNREGIWAEIESIVGSDNYLPKKLTASIDTIFSGILEKNGLEFGLNQENLENWYHKIYDVLNEQFSLNNRKYTELKASRKLNDYDRSSEESQDRVDSMYSSLNIKKRIRNQFLGGEYDNNKRMQPYGMFTFRYADVDCMILPIEEEILPEFVKKYMVSGKKPTIHDVEDILKLLQGKHFRFQAALNLLEYTVKVPTSMGLPVSMVHVLPILGSIDGTIKTKLKHGEVAIETNIHAVLTTAHLKRTEVWSPFVMTGAETSQTIEINLPINTEWKIETSGKKSATVTMEIPDIKTQVFGLHTLPHTYVAEVDKSTKLPRMPSVKRIENNRLQQQQRSIEKVYGDMTIGLPVKIYGDIHMPHDVTSYKKIVNTLLTSENHLHVELDPIGDSPRQIKLVIDGEAFSHHNDLSTYRQLKGFYSRAKFDDEYERHYQSENENENENELFDTFLNDYKPRKMYKHQGRIQLLTVGGRSEKYGKIEAEAVCDERVKFCQSIIKVTHSPFHQEDREWSMKIEAQSFYPEYVGHVDELERSDKKNQKFVSKIDMEWGSSDRKQEISVHINGKQFKPKRWIQKISRIEQQQYSYSSLPEQMRLKIAFLNKFDISANYKLQPSGQNIFSKYFAGLKALDFWSTQVKPINGRDGSFLATVIVDPITHEHLNITVKTPSEKVLIDSLHLPLKLKPFELVRKSHHSLISSNSLMDTVRSYNPMTNPECTVDNRKVKTFDEVTYKAPLSKCYSVLAKDCSSETGKFAVLLKKWGDGNMKLKMITGKQIIEVQPDTDRKLIVKINGDLVVDIQELLDYGIDYSDNKVIIDTHDVSVRFNGQKVWIKLAQTHKNTQCGLCGHYNDDVEDEFRMANNEHTYDLKGFHQSYTLEDKECKSDMEETYRRENYRRMDFDEYNSSEEREEKTHKKPIEKTQVVEYNHKVCFSEKPIKECPHRSEPKETEEKKIKYICFHHDSSEAREYLRMTRRDHRAKLDLPHHQNPSYTETVQVPISCTGYY